MNIRRMTATFGRLEKETLTLQPGLNILTVPNEGGKSTWAAFLLAMLYGVDTREQARQGHLPVKTRFRPWSGQAMAGSMELEWQGRGITLERTAQGRAPMGRLVAYETESGRPVDLPEGGQTLLGVERSVYERSGFLRQQGIALTADHALEARLEALVTTGDDAVSYRQVEKRLRDLRNRRRYNSSGLLPQAEAELARVRANRDELRGLGEDILTLQAKQEELEARLTALRRAAAARQAQALAQQREDLAALEEDWNKKEAALAEKESTVAALPPEAAIEDLRRTLDRLSADAAKLREDLDAEGPPPAAPACPPAFAGMTAEEIRTVADEDSRRLETLKGPPRFAPGRAWALLALTALALAAGVAGAVAARPAPAAVGFAAAAVAGILAAVRLLRNRNAARSARALLARYGAADAAGVRRMAEDCRAALLLFEQQTADAAARRAALETRRQDCAARWETLLAQMGALAPADADAAAAQNALQHGLNLWKFRNAAAQSAQSAREKYETAARVLGDLPAADQAAGAPEDRETAVARQELEQVRSQLDQSRGRMAASGDPAALAAREEQLQEDIERLSREYRALNLALAALERANGVLQTRFSPRINELASAYMARLTDGRYDRVLLGQDLGVTARQAGEVTARSLQELSAGTADQLYLAVRLAITEAVLPPDAPLVLDDALVAFDDARMAAALALLESLAQKRQILLFTCQRREQAWRDARPS